jgi:hypothetical protein
MIQWTMQDSATSSNSRSVNGTTYEQGTSEVAIDDSFAAGDTDVAKSKPFVAANLRGLAMTSTANVTIKVNSTGSPIHTFNLIAGTLYRWSYSEGYFPNPFTADSVNWYVTAGVAARLTGKILLA